LGGLKFQNIISGGLGEIYGLTKSGALYAWGNNVYGQLGVGDVIPRSSPVLVLGGLTWNQIFINGGSDTPIGVTTTGSVYSWGYNGNGQIGDGTTVSKSSPVLVLNTFALDNVDNSTTTSVTVVPGTTYTITLQKYNPQFGAVNVGSGVFDLITLQW
jgi:alpha-tubulin suppressor-like RCC1 family protein